MRKDTFCGVVEGKFDNTQEIEDVLNSTTIPKFFEQLKAKVREYYEIN